MVMNGQSVPPTIAVTILDPRCDSDWGRLIVSHPAVNFFHTAAWAEVVCKTYGHRPIYLRFSQQGESVALIPLIEVLSPFTGRRGVCLPFSDFCAPLVFDGNRLRLVMDELCKLAQERRWKYFEIRGEPAFETAAEPVTTFYGHKLDLRRGSEELFDRFSDGTKGAIRKAERSNLTVEVLRTRDAVLQFYQLHVETRKRHGLPPQPASFFLNIHQSIIETGLGFVVLAKRGLHPIAGAVFFKFGKRSIYKFAASNYAYREFCGNNLALWEGIKFLVQEGGELLHFGRTPLDNDGLRRFKLSWAAEEETISYFRFGTARRAWITARQDVATFHNKLFRRLPVRANRLLGTMIYPHLH